MRKCRDLIRLRNRFKLLEGSLLAVIDLLLDAKFITLYFISRVGDDFHKKKSMKKSISCYQVMMSSSQCYHL